MGFDMLRDMPKTCIIVPCYNEAKRLNSEKLIAYLKSNQWMHICFINDGSLDNTMGVLTNITSQAPNNSSIVNLDQNHGKAEAVRKGMMMCNDRDRYDFIGFLDADMATPIAEIEKMVMLDKNSENILMLSGCRVRRLGAFIDRTPVRHYLGRIFATFASMALGLPTYDTQCGAKIFRRSIVKQLFGKPFISKWLFDVEIFARICQTIGPEETRSRVSEVPLTQWKEIPGSKIDLLQYFTAPVDLLRIYYHYVLLNRK